MSRRASTMHVAGAARPRLAARPGRAPPRARARSRAGSAASAPASAASRSAPAAFGSAEEAQGDDRGLLGQPRRRRDRLVRRLVRLVGLLDQVGEDAVDEAQDGGPRAEVLRQVQDARPRGAPLATQLAEEAHLGAPEAVDRLLGVAHHHERAGPVAGEEPRHLDLQRVGVLELVDHQEAEALPEPGADARVVAQRVARLHQQVEEVEDAALGLLALVDRDDALERAHQARRGDRRRAPPSSAGGPPWSSRRSRAPRRAPRAWASAA